MKQTKLQKMKQKGFTLLELLVVITLLAILSVGALVAYEGIGDTAQATAASNNTARADQAIRNFKAVTQNYPDQWDNLVTTAGTSPLMLANATRSAFASWAVPVSVAADDFRDELNEAFEDVGITEIQQRTVQASDTDVEPNLQHNEGAATNVTENDFDTVTNLAVLPSFGGAVCTTAMGTYPTATMLQLDEDGAEIAASGTTIAAAAGNRQNAINDSLEEDECNLVVALGFGHDAAHSTNGSSVAISTAPTFISKNINPNENYARYVALFHVAHDEDGNNALGAGEVFDKARLIAIVDAEGNVIDENIAAATDQTAN